MCVELMKKPNNKLQLSLRPLNRLQHIDIKPLLIFVVHYDEQEQYLTALCESWRKGKTEKAVYICGVFTILFTYNIWYILSGNFSFMTEKLLQHIKLNK